MLQLHVEGKTATGFRNIEVQQPLQQSIEWPNIYQNEIPLSRKI